MSGKMTRPENDAYGHLSPGRSMSRHAGPPDPNFVLARAFGGPGITETQPPPVQEEESLTEQENE